MATRLCRIEQAILDITKKFPQMSMVKPFLSAYEAQLTISAKSTQLPLKMYCCR